MLLVSAPPERAYWDLIGRGTLGPKKPENRKCPEVPQKPKAP